MAIPGHVFVPYADMSLSPTFSLAETAKQTGNEFFTLAFILAGSTGQPAWGGQIAADGHFLGDDITSLRGQGGDVIVSFGGATGTELAQATGDVATLQAQYQAVIDAYTLTAIDFDIEGVAVADGPSVDRRNAAIAGLQSAAQAAGRDLAISYTLPVALDGLTTDGLNLLKNARAHGVNISLVNIMALDYGGSAPPDQMGQNAITAAQAVSGQLSGASWAAIGVTPMIGVNDTTPEVFTLQDAQDLLRFAEQNNLGRLAMWSVTRDQPCPGGPGGAAQATCSGVDQQPLDFTNTFKTFGRAKMSTPTPGQKYAIRPGDTLFSIATTAYGAANASQGVTAIETANPGLNPTDLQAGQEINIPILGGTGAGPPTPGQPYAIRPGDTLFNIATTAYGAANASQGVTAIETANPGLNPTDLQAGQEINIPVLGGTSPPPPGQGGLTSDQIQAILAAHNSYRAQVGVPPLQWSDSLAVSSQNWANQLAETGTLVHSHGPYGENLAEGTAGGFSVTQLVDIWGNEKQFFIAGTFPNVSTTGNWDDVGHYTQVVWRDTTQVGGGLATGNGSDFLVCQYLPEGNVVGQAVF